MELISVCETILYYCCLLLAARSILGLYPKKVTMIISFFVFIPLAIIAAFGAEATYYAVHSIYVVLQFFIIKLIFKGIQLSHIFFIYVVLYCVNIITISLVIPTPDEQHLLIDVIVNTASILIFFLICLSKTKYRVRQILLWTPKYILILSSFVLIAISVTIVLFLGAQYSLHQNTWQFFSRTGLILLTLVICFILPIFIISAISTNRLKHLAANYEQQILAQSEHYSNLAAANFETRRFKHDFKNISIGIEKMLADGNYEQALDYLRSYNRDLNTPGVFCSAFDTGNGIADALLTDKQERASACNTIIAFHGVFPVNFLSPTDLCVVLGNSLDNAIEACQKLSPEQVKTISLDCTCNSGFLFLTISNPVDHKVAIRDNYVATTKENKTLHGFGLYSLHSVVRKYNGDIRLTSTDTSFTVNIDLCMVFSKPLENSLPL